MLTYIVHQPIDKPKPTTDIYARSERSLDNFGQSEQLR